MHKTKILFLLKKNSEYGYQIGVRSGLYNSVNMLSKEIEKNFLAEVKIAICIDGNSIDKELHDYKPNIAIIEALWVTPDKLKELRKLHPNIMFVVRIHSEIPFLSNEGIAIDWIKGYQTISSTIVGFNSKNAFDLFSKVLKGDFLYLPNVYDSELVDNIKCHASRRFKQGSELNIGCFGAIRPMKNQLFQAFLAIIFADKYKLKLKFHVNGTRIEQKGEPVLKNLRALFKDSNHELIEHPWMDREEFLDLVSKMDLGMQLSLNESFNIVAADFVAMGVPIVVSETIDWMPSHLTANIEYYDDILSKMNYALKHAKYSCISQKLHLINYNINSILEWRNL